MNRKEVREKSIEELEKDAASLELAVSDHYFEMRTGKLKNVRKPRMQRKELALLKTIIREKKNEDKMSSEKHG